METDWPKVERTLKEVEERLAQASNEEQFQAVGLLCRETLISLAQVVYDPDIHRIDGIAPSETDAKRMLESYLTYELQGQTHEVARKYAKSALDLANVLQHKRTASFRDAALCLEATTSVVKIISLISGRLELSSREAPYKKVESLMPELIAEMRNDLRNNPLVRQFYIAKKSWVMNTREMCFTYYFEDHDNLQGKMHVLENLGFVIDVSVSDTKWYRMMEHVVDHLLSSQNIITLS